MNGNLVTIIGAVIILTVLVVVGYHLIKKNKNDNGEALKFLDGLGDRLLEIVLDTIKNTRPEDIVNNIEEFEITVLNAIYDNCWNYVTEEINKKLDNDSTLKLILSAIDKEFVIRFIDSLCEKAGITASIEEQYVVYQNEIVVKPAVATDTEVAEYELDKEFSETEYHTGDEEVTDKDLEPAKEETHTEEEITALNPQRDEDDEEFDTDCMEEVEDETGKIVALQDKNGIWKFYELDENGKKKQVSKTYAIPKLEEQGETAILEAINSSK